MSSYREKNKILHVITGLGHGGAEHMLYKLLGREKTYLSPAVVSLLSRGIYADKIRALGIPVLELGLHPGRLNPLAIVRLRKIVAELDPQLIHGWMYHGALASVFAAKRKPLIIAIRQSLADQKREKILTRLAIQFLGKVSVRAARICYNSYAGQRQHEKMGYPSKHNIVIPNGFDCDICRPMPEVRSLLRSQLTIPDDAIVIGHLGRHHPVKGHEVMLEAFRKVLRKLPNAILVMAGTSVTWENYKLRTKIECLGLRACTQLLGEQENIPNLINAFDLLVNSSYSEGFPNVLGEAMACGVPCVATGVGDSAYVIGDVGVVVPPGDPDALCTGILQIADMPKDARDKMGTLARKRIIDDFSLDRIMREYKMLYETILQEYHDLR